MKDVRLAFGLLVVPFITSNLYVRDIFRLKKINR